MYKSVSNEHILVNQSVSILYLDVNEDIKNLICKNSRHQHFCVQLSKIQLRYPLLCFEIRSNGKTPIEATT